MLQLKSDFIDYYDHWFANSYQEYPIFSRLSVDGISREAQFAKLQAMGLQVPEHGMVSALYRDYETRLQQQGFNDTEVKGMLELMQLVVYTDPYAHAGEGKCVLGYSDALRLYPTHFASLYIMQNVKNLGISLRYLRIGKRQFWLRYASENDWRSNAGEVSITLLSEEKPKSLTDKLKHPEPLLAVDFITGQGGGLLAIDHNTAPKLKGTGIENVLPAKEAVAEIVSWYFA